MRFKFFLWKVRHLSLVSTNEVHILGVGLEPVQIVRGAETWSSNESKSKKENRSVWWIFDLRHASHKMCDMPEVMTAIIQLIYSPVDDRFLCLLIYLFTRHLQRVNNVFRGIKTLRMRRENRNKTFIKAWRRAWYSRIKAVLLNID